MRPANGREDIDELEAGFVGGVATLANVPPGPLHLRVLQSGLLGQLLCEKELTIAEGDEVEVECEKKDLRVSGVVTVGGIEVGPGHLSWLPPAPQGMSGVFHRENSLGLRQTRAVGMGAVPVVAEVAADGTFYSEDLRPGSWEVYWKSPGGDDSAKIDVRIPDVEEHSLTLDEDLREETAIWGPSSAGGRFAFMDSGNGRPGVIQIDSSGLGVKLLGSPFLARLRAVALDLRPSRRQLYGPTRRQILAGQREQGRERGIGDRRPLNS